MNLMKYSALAVLLISLISVGCSQQTEEKTGEVKTGQINNKQTTESEIKELVRRYDDLLSIAYITNDLSDMKDVITADHSARLEHRLSNINKAGRQMRTELKGIHFGAITSTGDRTVTVDATETWDIKHVDLSTQKALKEHTGYVYELRYEIAEQNGKWLVNSVDVLNEQVSEPKKSGE